jgi:hypothetical protein
MSWRIALTVAAGAAVACYQVATEPDRRLRMILAAIGAATIGVSTAYALRPRTVTPAVLPDGGWRAPVINLAAWRRAA